MVGIVAPQFQDADAAREHIEKILWPDGPVCPKCGLIGEAYKLQGKTTRRGLYKCAGCREPFTVTMGTIFEDSKVPLHKWLLAIHLMCSSKKGISAHQLMRNLDIGSYRTAWFIAHRLRWAMGQEPLASKLAGIVEVDETYIGPKRTVGPHPYRGGDPSIDRNPFAEKAPVVAILERGGNVHSRSVKRVTGETLKPIIAETIEKGTVIMTDSATHLKFPEGEGHAHHTVNHKAKEYVRHEDGLTITTNTVEGYFAILKRGNYGVFHHWDRKYMDQYLREFDFRYNVRRLNDTDRATLALRKTSGKRLMMREPKEAKVR